jgi:hypothetical protein
MGMWVRDHSKPWGGSGQNETIAAPLPPLFLLLFFRPSSFSSRLYLQINLGNLVSPGLGYHGNISALLNGSHLRPETRNNHNPSQRVKRVVVVTATPPVPVLSVKRSDFLLLLAVSRASTFTPEIV